MTISMAFMEGSTQSLKGDMQGFHLREDDPETGLWLELCLERWPLFSTGT